MEKNFILDTNVLLHDPRSFFTFEDNNVVIPIYVIEEVDKFKRDLSELGRNARLVARYLDALRADPARFDVTCLRVMVSSGMMWSPEVKTGLLEFMPEAMLVDSFGASEGAGIGVSITSRETDAIDGSASPRNPSVPMASRSSVVRSFDVACRSNASSASS